MGDNSPSPRGVGPAGHHDPERFLRVGRLPLKWGSVGAGAGGVETLPSSEANWPPTVKVQTGPERVKRRRPRVSRTRSSRRASDERPLPAALGSRHSGGRSCGNTGGLPLRRSLRRPEPPAGNTAPDGVETSEDRARAAELLDYRGPAHSSAGLQHFRCDCFELIWIQLDDHSDSSPGGSKSIELSPSRLWRVGVSGENTARSPDLWAGLDAEVGRRVRSDHAAPWSQVVSIALRGSLGKGCEAPFGRVDTAYGERVETRGAPTGVHHCVAHSAS